MHNLKGLSISSSYCRSSFSYFQVLLHHMEHCNHWTSVDVTINVRYLSTNTEIRGCPNKAGDPIKAQLHLKINRLYGTPNHIVCR